MKTKIHYEIVIDTINDEGNVATRIVKSISERQARGLDPNMVEAAKQARRDFGGPRSEGNFGDGRGWHEGDTWNRLRWFFYCD